MKSFHTLTADVKTHNLVLAGELYNRRPHLFSNPPVIANGYASFNTTCCKSRIPTDYVGAIGKAQHNASCLWDGALNLDAKGAMTAVLTVIDSLTKTQESDVFPVVLCVGINYGQQGGRKNYCKGQGLCDATGMRKNLQSALNLANVTISLGQSHLVAANFFPWITLKSWQNVAPNCLVSALLLRSFGFEDPGSAMASLIDRIGPSCLVFHGSGNAVPMLALETIQKCQWKTPKILICDNLGYHVQWNSVSLL
jgi:hypothetical protein